MDKIERDRIRFIKKMKSIASDINKNLLYSSFNFEVFFSGRDEDFFNMIFSKENELIKVQIELENHRYKIIGSEKLNCSIENGESGEIDLGRGTKLKKDNLDSLILSFVKDHLK